jgi:hypothetical protein
MSEDKHDKLSDTWVDRLPFVAIATKGERSTASQLMVRLGEAAIIGAIVMFGTVQTLQHDIESIKSTINEIKANIEKIENDLYKPIYRGGG